MTRLIIEYGVECYVMLTMCLLAFTQRALVGFMKILCSASTMRLTDGVNYLYHSFTRLVVFVDFIFSYMFLLGLVAFKWGLHGFICDVRNEP